MKILSNYSFPGDDEFDICCFSGKFHDRDYESNEKAVTFDEILRNLPTGWEPDVVLFKSLLYSPIPIGIENSPYPTVGLLDDWFSGIDFLPDNCLKFDYICTDIAGINLLKKLGINNTFYWPHFGYNPSLFRKIDGEKRIYDVTFTGNFNPNVQGERLKWLHRIAQLNSKYNIKIFNNVYNEEYAKVLNMSRIVFNRSIKGEMNMRVYEAIACGALLFLEEENLEVRDMLVPDKEVVLYNNDNLEELIDYYLNHEEEREKIATAGHKRIQEYSYPKLFKVLIDKIKSLGITPKENRKKPFFYFNNSMHCDVVQHIISIKPYGYDIFEKIQELITDKNVSHNILNDCSVFLADFQKNVGTVKEKSDFLRQAVTLLDYAGEKMPGYILGDFNKAQILLESNQKDQAEELYKKIAHSENVQDWLCYNGMIYPFNYAFPYFVFWSMCLLDFSPDKSEMAKARHRIIRAFASSRIADIAVINSDNAKAKEYYELAKSQFDSGYFILTPLALIDEDDYEKAKKNIEDAIKLNSFDTNLWRKYIKVLAQNGDSLEAKRFADNSILCLSRIQDEGEVKQRLSSVLNEHDKVKDVIDDFVQLRQLMDIM